MNTTASTDTYPRQYSRTQRLSLGEPRNITISPDGQSVLFLRSRSGSDPVNCLWHLDVASKKETLIADPLVMLGGSDDQDLPPAEKPDVKDCVKVPVASPHTQQMRKPNNLLVP